MMKCIVLFVNTVLVDQNSFAFKETHSVPLLTHPSFEYKLLTKKLRAGTTWAASWDLIQNFFGQGEGTPVRPLGTREVILIWCCVCRYCTTYHLLSTLYLWKRKKHGTRYSYFSILYPQPIPTTYHLHSYTSTANYISCCSPLLTHPPQSPTSLNNLKIIIEPWKW